MKLLPRELDKLTLSAAGALAQRRLARGVRLNYPEAVALIAAQCLELIRDGRTVAELMDLGRSLLGRRQVGTLRARARMIDRSFCGFGFSDFFAVFLRADGRRVRPSRR
jgi:urease gamma subunit